MVTRTTAPAATTPVPPPPFMPQSSPVPVAPSSPRTSQSKPSSSGAPTEQQAKLPEKESSSNATAAAAATVEFPMPKLRVEFRDLLHPGSDVFLRGVTISAAFPAQIQALLRLLYLRPPGKKEADPAAAAAKASEAGDRNERSDEKEEKEGEKRKEKDGEEEEEEEGKEVADGPYHVPPTRSVTLVLRDMPGVAYTTGSELDAEHKEIHVSLAYLAGLPGRLGSAGARAAGGSSNTAAAGPAAVTREILGVLTHELVHCYQWNGRGAAPGGLVEGVADWVRLRAGLAAAHWEKGRREGLRGRWDQGYQATGFFLDFLERRFGDGSVRRINEALRLGSYEEGKLWVGLFGWEVERLWEKYVKASEEEEEGKKEGEEQGKGLRDSEKSEKNNEEDIMFVEKTDLDDEKKEGGHD